MSTPDASAFGPDRSHLVSLLLIAAERAVSYRDAQAVCLARIYAGGGSESFVLSVCDRFVKADALVTALYERLHSVTEF